MHFFFSGRGDSHNKTMNIFFSGSTYDNALPEQALSQSNDGRGPCLMLTHHELHEGVNSTRQRFGNIEKARLGSPLEKERVWMHFLDSGAFSLYSKYVMDRRANFGISTKDLYRYYYSDRFWKRVDRYAAFVKKHKVACDYYANLDVIHHPELTWKVQQYLEDHHKLEPVPVVHFGTKLKWIKHYLDHGYEMIGLGGFGHNPGVQNEYFRWASSVYDLLCPGPKRVPIVKVHGFAMTGYSLLTRYPWWSVDSASWCKAGGYGVISVPHKRGGKFDFDIKPYNIVTSREASARTGKQRSLMPNARHIETVSAAEKKILLEWLDYIELPLGSVDKWGDAKAWGVISNFRARIIANLKFFKQLEESLPEWPWKFTPAQERTSLNL